jgi:hypothetical protein
MLPNVGPYNTTLKFLALQGAPYIYDISRLKVNSVLNLNTFIITFIIIFTHTCIQYGIPPIVTSAGKYWSEDGLEKGKPCIHNRVKMIVCCCCFLRNKTI